MREPATHESAARTPATSERESSLLSPSGSGRLRFAQSCGLFLVLLLVSLVVAAALGTVSLPFEHSLAVLLERLFGLRVAGVEPSAATVNIVWEIRFPRVLLALLVGAGLALCGCVMQAAVRNPLGDPYILGVSSGGALGATFAILVGALLGGLFGQIGIGIWAFLGALGATFLVMFLAGVGGRATSVKLILAGTIVNALCTAFSNFVISVAGTSEGIRSVTFWLMGSLSAADWERLPLIAVVVLFAALLFATQGRSLNILLLGDDAAITLGVNAGRLRRLYLAGAALITGVIVANCGMIGFVGLIVPHAVRGMVGSDHRRLVPLALCVGALFMIWADVLARTIIPQTELPIGVVTALVGAPLFAWILFRKGYGFGGN
jgi:iron complex transport system permease protein